ncbi:hypothetical protein OPV22_003992 [Ensete ventricosum]|uniref:BAG domain-containing protein n=1 Tax=Ensete ventricosum TaxID=4639 RepID=A0AAV8S253_ENSVE|nr:hypothetical protein OPV22_003992 [Ensete ventricosum]
MKSSVAACRSVLADETHVDPRYITEKAMDLLLRLDAIQSGDPMVREGKRSISRELVRMLDFIDKELESSIENGGKYVKGKHFQNQNGKLGLSAPLPLQMELRKI